MWKLTALGVLCPMMVHAGFVDNKVQWDAITLQNKHGYVMGVYDETMVQVTGQDQLNRFKNDLSDCAISLGLGSVQLTEIVDNEYKELQNWELPVVLVLSTGLRKVCLASINRARTVRGEVPM